MNDTHQEPIQKTPRGPSKGTGRQLMEAASEDFQSPLPHDDGGRYDLIQRNSNVESPAMGDILVDLEACPGGSGLVVWIVGG